MGRKGGNKRYFSKGFKLSVVQRNIDGESSGKLSKQLVWISRCFVIGREHIGITEHQDWSRNGILGIL